MIGRLVHKADFERLLATRSRSRSAHFAVHHVASAILAREKAAARGFADSLSTGRTQTCPEAVDDCPGEPVLGVVVPKRHARRAVTRNLIKRQIRCAMESHVQALAHGHWLLRLTAGFATAQFVSARSPALAQAVRHELDALLARVLP